MCLKMGKNVLETVHIWTGGSSASPGWSRELQPASPSGAVSLQPTAARLVPSEHPQRLLAQHIFQVCTERSKNDSSDRKPCPAHPLKSL